MKLTKEQIEEYLQTQIAKDVKTVLAFTIDKTKTEVDNQVVAGTAEYAELIGEELAEVELMEPTEKDALDAAIRILQVIAEQTKTKIDDIVVGLMAKLTGANKEKNM